MRNETRKGVKHDKYRHTHTQKEGKCAYQNSQGVSRKIMTRIRDPPVRRIANQ